MPTNLTLKEQPRRAKPGQCYIAGNGAVVHVSKVGEPCECSQRAQLTTTGEKR